MATSNVYRLLHSDNSNEVYFEVDTDEVAIQIVRWMLKARVTMGERDFGIFIEKIVFDAEFHDWGMIHSQSWRTVVELTINSDGEIIEDTDQL